MESYNWFNKVCQLFGGEKAQEKKHKDYLPISLFLVAGKFDNKTIDSIMDYGEQFIKELKY